MPYRDMQRKGKVGGLQFQIGRAIIPDIDAIPGLASAIEEFSRKGKELPDWTPVNISDRIKAVRLIDVGAALSLSGASMSIYRHASELLHGTYFSVIYFWSGSTGPVHTRERFGELWKEHFIAVFTAIFFSASAVVELCSRKYNLPSLARANEELISRVKEIIDSLSAGGSENISI